MIKNPILVRESFMGNEVIFKTVEEAEFVKKEMKLDTSILETRHGRFMIRMNSDQYGRFLSRVDGLSIFDK